MHLVVIGNYRLDRQKSMDAYAVLMMEPAGRWGCRAEVLCPPVVPGGVRPAKVGFGKWLGYIDKYVFFPPLLVLRFWGRRLREQGRVGVHIVDHSNAMYSQWLPRSATVTTCHDMLAIRAGL